MMTVTYYQILVYIHLLLFVLWLGADVGVFMLGQHFRKRAQYDLPQRLVLLQLFVNLDMVPRSAWALMVPVTLTMVDAGGWWDLPGWALVLAWVVGGVWLWLVWDAHHLDGLISPWVFPTTQNLICFGIKIEHHFTANLAISCPALGISDFDALPDIHTFAVK